MKNKTLFYLLLFQLIALVLLFPYTPNGEIFYESVFGAGNLNEEELIPPPTPTPVPTPTPTPIPLSAFYTELRDELPGRYELVSFRNAGDEFSDALLTKLRGLGVPMGLELHPDGSATLGVFDQAILLEADFDRMLVTVGERVSPFFYLDGQLRVQDGEQYMRFEKQG